MNMHSKPYRATYSHGASFETMNLCPSVTKRATRYEYAMHDDRHDATYDAQQAARYDADIRAMERANSL